MDAVIQQQQNESWRLTSGKHKGKQSNELSETELYAVWNWHFHNRPQAEMSINLTVELKRRGLPLVAPKWMQQGNQPGQPKEKAIPLNSATIERQDGTFTCPDCGRDKRTEKRDPKKQCCGWIILETDWTRPRDFELDESDPVPFDL